MLGTKQKCLFMSIKDMYRNVLSNVIYNSPKLETTQMSINNRWGLSGWRSG